MCHQQDWSIIKGYNNKQQQQTNINKQEYRQGRALLDRCVSLSHVVSSLLWNTASLHGVGIHAATKAFKMLENAVFE